MGKEQKARVIFHVDMDAFFASVEQRDHPEYRGKPLVIGGLSGRGVVSTCSYEARRYGVHSAMPMGEAQRRCPQAVFLPGDYARYREASAEVFQVFTAFAPVVEPLSIDEAFLDMTGMERLIESPRAYAVRLKEEIRQRVGLVASIGIAPNKFLAKVASDLEKPDGLVVVPPDAAGVRAFLWPLPVRRIWGGWREDGPASCGAPCAHGRRPRTHGFRAAAGAVRREDSGAAARALLWSR